MSYAQSQSYSVSSSSGGGGGGGGGSVQMSMSGGGGGSSGFSSMSGGRGDVSLSSSRKTDITRTSGSRGGGGGQSMLMALSSLGGGTAAYAGTHDLGSNPTSVIANRQREKHDLEDLNKKLADYISSVGYYKAKVKEQEQIIANFKGKFESMEANLRAIYDPEMENLRGTIDATAREKAQVELKVETLENLYKDFRSKYEAELSAHEVTRASVPKLQRELSEKDAQIDFLAKTLSSLEPQVGALKSQISTYQKESIDAKMGADAEIVRRVELESKLVTKEEEIAFLKRLYEEKLRMALDLDMDSADVQAIYSKELGNALCDIRAEYQAQLEAIRQGGGDDSWYQQRFNAMMQTSEKQGRELVMAKEEVVKAKTKYSEAVQSTGAMRNEIASLKAMVDDLQSAMEEEKKAHSVAIGDRDAQCVEYKKQIAAHIMELKGLMDIKLGLDTQIAEYRRLLLSEETRMRGETGSAGGGGGAVTMQSSSSTFSSSGGGSSGMSSGGGSSGFSSGSTMSQSSSSSWSSSTVTTSTYRGASAAERDHYMRVFRHFDRNGNGIDVNEMKTVLDWADDQSFGGRARRNASDEYCRSLMATGDADSSGSLDFEEFLKLMIFEKKFNLMRSFRSADVGGKGYLTEQEVVVGLRSAGYEVADTADLLRNAVHEDGKVRYEDFVRNL